MIINKVTANGKVQILAGTDITKVLSDNASFETRSSGTQIRIIDENEFEYTVSVGSIDKVQIDGDDQAFANTQALLALLQNSIFNNSQNNSSIGVGSTAANVSQSATSGLLLAANANRKFFWIDNNSSSILYLLFGTGTASSINYTIRIFPNAQIPIKGTTEQINGIWAAAGSGFAMITEVV